MYSEILWCPQELILHPISAGLGQKKASKYVPSFLPPNLAAAINAQTNPHTGAAAAAAAVSSRLGGVSKLSGSPVLYRQPGHLTALPAWPAHDLRTHRGLTAVMFNIPA